MFGVLLNLTPGLPDTAEGARHTLALFNLGPLEITVIVALMLLLFGGRKLPELVKGLGQGLKEFKAASREIANDDEKQAKDVEPTEGAAKS